MKYLYLQCGSDVRDPNAWLTVAIVRETDATDRFAGLKQRHPDVEWRMVDESAISNRTVAEWSISLDVCCPYCGELFDLLSDEWPEGVEACEQDTDATRNVDVECSKCHRMLVVDFEY